MLERSGHVVCPVQGKGREKEKNGIRLALSKDAQRGEAGNQAEGARRFPKKREGADDPNLRRGEDPFVLGGEKERTL